MEGQYVPRSRPMSKPCDPAVDTNQRHQGVQRQPPPRRQSNHGVQQQQPGVADWGNNAGDGYGNVDPAQGYDEGHYGYDGQGHGYGGEQGHGQEQGYAAPTKPARMKKNTGPKPRPGADHAYTGEYEANYTSQHQGDGCGQQAQGSYKGGYENQYQGDYHGQQWQGSYEEGYGIQHQGVGYAEPVQGISADGHAHPEAVPGQKPKREQKGKSSKNKSLDSRNNANYGDGAYAEPANGAYMPQQGKLFHGVNRDNGVVPAAGVMQKERNTNKQGRNYPGAVAEERPYAESLPSRAINRVQGDHHDGTGSARSRSSNEGSVPGRSKSSDREGSGSGQGRAENYEPRTSRAGSSQQEGTSSGTPRLNANIVRDGGSSHAKSDHCDGSGKSNPERGTRSRDHKLEKEGSGGTPRGVAKPGGPSPPIQANPLNKEYLRKLGGGKPKAVYQDESMVVFVDKPKPQPASRPIEASKAPPPPRPASINEWVKKTSGQKYQQDESLIVFNDPDKSSMETQFFGGALGKKQSFKLPPVETPSHEEPGVGPLFRPNRGGNQNKQYPPVVEEGPEYKPTQRRRYDVNSPLPPSNGLAAQGAQVDKQIQPVVPNAKCMACVHGIGVPLARCGTRILCRQCMTCFMCIIL